MGRETDMDVVGAVRYGTRCLSDSRPSPILFAVSDNFGIGHREQLRQPVSASNFLQRKSDI